jgi:hypothetical protein
LTSTGFPEDTLPILTIGVGGAGGPQGRLELDPSLQQPFYYIPSEPVQRPRPVCQTILQDVVVMKTGDFALAVVSAEAAQQQPQAAPQAPDIVTLIVSPQDLNTVVRTYTTPDRLTCNQATSLGWRRGATLQFLLISTTSPSQAALCAATIDALVRPLSNSAVTSPVVGGRALVRIAVQGNYACW